MTGKGGDDGKGGGDDGLQMKMPLISNLMIFLRTAVRLGGGEKFGEQRCSLQKTRVVCKQKKGARRPLMKIL